MKKVFCLLGPTAAGKTGLACELATRFPLELISVDSAMVYRGMDIGTAKPTPQELVLNPHHLINILDPPDSFSAADFCQRVQELCELIWAKGKIPFLVGGTMMYFNALQQGLSSLPPAQPAIREQLNEQAQAIGWEAMHRLLAQIDPDSARKFHYNDTQRIQRALEIFQTSGRTLSSFLKEKNAHEALDCVNLLLMPVQRQWLHQRIAERFDIMLHQGFLEEVQALLDNWQLSALCPSMRCVGYRQAIPYLQGETRYEDFYNQSLAATRQLAKRQLTWLRSWPQGAMFACDEDGVLKKIATYITQVISNDI